MAVLTFVSARIPPERHGEVVRIYTETIGQGLPPDIRQTFLLSGDDGTMAVASVWRSREGLDAMLGTGEEPFARRLLREAGGEPEARFFDVLAERTAPAGPE